MVNDCQGLKGANAMKLRSLLLSTVVVGSACNAALAADLPSRRAPPVFVPPPVFVWTGFYLGAYAGGHFGGTNNIGGVVDLKKSGFVAGGLAGFNWQFNQIVLGGEGEAGYADYNKTFGPISTKTDVSGRIRGRLGYALGPIGFGQAAMIYAAGGASFLPIRFTVGGAGLTLDRTGFNVGAGVEVAVTPNWIVRAEYIYDDYGTKNLGGLLPVKTTDNTVRGAIEYKFDWAAPAPVVARY